MYEVKVWSQLYGGWVVRRFEDVEKAVAFARETNGIIVL